VHFKGQYLMAMRQRAPKMFVELCKSGQLDHHVREKSVEAHALLDQLLANEPKDVAGLPKDLQASRIAEEMVMAQMLDFAPSDTSELAEDLPAPRSAARTSHLRPVK
jgi:hypothetical protein